MKKKTITIFEQKKSISILITILTQTDMLYSYKCILCEFETYFQRKPIRPFPKSCNMSPLMFRSLTGKPNPVQITRSH